MTHFVPRVATGNGMLSIQFADSDIARSTNVDCVLDLTYLGDVVGVEILDLRRQLSGGRVEALSAGGQIQWSYDDEIDAFYVQILEDRAQVQRSATGKAHLDSGNRVVRLEVPVPST